MILGDVNKAACASADTINVWDIGDNATPGGSPEDPELLFTIFEPGVGEAGTNGRWHSAGIAWDGEVLVAGWEPGGGAEPAGTWPSAGTTRPAPGSPTSPNRPPRSPSGGPTRRRSGR